MTQQPAGPRASGQDEPDRPGPAAQVPQLRRRRLPARQPARALLVVLLYLLAAGAGYAVLTGLYGSLGLVLAVFLAAALTIPLAVLAPRPVARPDDDDRRPVLLPRDIPPS